MKLYRVSYSDTNQHWGYSWHGSRREAQKAANDYVKNNQPDPDSQELYRKTSSPDQPEIELVQVEPGKRGLVAFASVYATHNDNG